MNKNEMNASDKVNGVYVSGSYGTTGYWVVSPFIGKRLVMTSGVKDMLEELSAYWLGDVIASYAPKLNSGSETFFTCRLIKTLNDGCTFLIYSDDGILVKQEIPYTDIGMNVKMFIQTDGEKWIVMMPTEY